MRVARLNNGKEQLTAVQQDGRLFAFRAESGGAPSALQALTDQANTGVADPEPLSDGYRVTVPFRPVRNVICLGKNFRAHAEEYSTYRRESETAPTDPIVFTKAPESLCGATDDIEVWETVAGSLDYEVELGVIIGQPGARIAADSALSHVAGYTVVNDITARDIQERHKQWFLGKSLPRATPIGPVIVTPDELPQLGQREISSSVNGEPRQSALLGDMIFDVAKAISLLSSVVPLVRGDIISMGTPAGVGIGFSPPRFLRDGDEVVCKIDGIGELRNTIRFVDSIPSGPWG